MPASDLSYKSIRATVDASSDETLSRVEVNQRALIDKILARYASAGAVYRELLQNSNDAEADTAEIYFTTVEGTSTVAQVIYRNNGMPFRPQDWSRLKKIAEGNPDVSKIGAFGVGAYTMFSICEEPLVISGSEALAFVWKGDALWTKTAPNHQQTGPVGLNRWTTFVLPSRDPYQLPDWDEFGTFLAASLTFTSSLRQVRVFVNAHERLTIFKALVQEPRPISTLKTKTGTNSWFWNRSDAVTTTPRGFFSFSSTTSSAAAAILESVYRITVQVTEQGGSKVETSSIDARYVTANATTNIPSDTARRMERVTKKKPPPTVNLQVFLNAQSSFGSSKPKNQAERITRSFIPQPGKGRIFIGFRTSQTTGLAAHVAAPFVPTVEREAMDLQDPTLRLFNTELLELTGQLLRLTLEDTMYNVIDVAWKGNAAERQRLENELRLQHLEKRSTKGAVLSSVSTPDGSDNGETASEDAVDTAAGFMNFARFMARGVKKKIVSVVNTVEEMIDDGAEYLKPTDLLPLSPEEEQAVVLMQSFCPQQSTPDPLVGTCIAQGFSRCLPNTAPPVLTRSGVVQGSVARLPYRGIESFVLDNVVRRVVFQNAEEYHTLIAPCRNLALSDLVHAVKATLFDEEKLCFLIKWWVKYNHVDSRGAEPYSLAVKESIRFYVGSGADRSVMDLKNILFYVDRSSVLSKRLLPLPDAVLPPRLQECIGDSTLTDYSLEPWFSPLPTEIWSEFISHHPCLVEARGEDGALRLHVLKVLCMEFSRRSHAERTAFGGFLASVLSSRPCIPCDKIHPDDPVADKPSELYSRSAELKAFDGLGSFRKVSGSLSAEGIADDFLLALGVRKSVSIDFLFTSLESLRWSSDPKPLIEYLRSATLTNADIAKLSRTRYLPAENDDTRTYAPTELYLPNLDLRIFPFLKILRWPSESEVSERSENGLFLVKLGIQVMPPLATILTYLTNDVNDSKKRQLCLDFLTARLGPKGHYRDVYAALKKDQFRFLPCIRKDPFGSDEVVSEVHSPVSCFSDRSCILMGFPVLDFRLGEASKVYGSLFQCPTEPRPNDLLSQLLHIVAKAKALPATTHEGSATTQKILGTLSEIFDYLSHRSSDFSSSALSALRRESFIPCAVSGSVKWFRVDQVFFRGAPEQRDELTEDLFQLVGFSPFLATVGVKQEATTKDLFELMLSSPQDVLNTLGSESKYRTLLRRIAANPPFSQVTQAIRNSPFLLSYTLTYQDSGSPDSGTFELAKAQDIFIVDNSFFGRMFPVKRAPHESDLEEFYVKLGSSYISKSVDRRFEVVGKPLSDTPLTNALKQRILERSPLLVSPSVTSRPLVPNASSLFTDSRLSILEASKLMAVYSLNGVTRRNATSCFSRPLGRNVNAIYVVSDFDWFDVGYAVGDLVLKRCQLEDAFFISSLLEAPVDQLRARGFPVDRIVKPEPPPLPPSPPPAPPKVSQPTSNASGMKSAGLSAERRESDTANNATSTMEANGIASAGSSAERREGDPPNKATNASDRHPDHAAASVSNEANESADHGPGGDGFEQILKQMYPQVDPTHLRNLLGTAPTLDKVQRIAEELAQGQFPRDDDGGSNDDAGTVASSTTSKVELDDPLSPAKRNKSGLRQKIGRAFGIRGSSGAGGSGGAVAASHAPSGSVVREETARPVPSISDAQSHSGLEQMLKKAVQSSSHVNQQGVHSSDATVVTSIPEGLDRGETCEMHPGHSLQPLAGPNGRLVARNGIRVFSARGVGESEEFLRLHPHVVESFSVVLERLCSVYGLSTATVAIFHDPRGGTIAFNANRALHFNLRFYFSLHYDQRPSPFSSECYAYWFVTMAHELAHHMVSAHNKEHGFYTESYVSMYLPKLAPLLASLEPSKGSA